MIWGLSGARRMQLTAKRREHRKGLVRATAYFGALAFVLSVVQVRSARAEVASRSLQIGRQLLDLARATQHDVNKVTVNGQAMWVASSLSDDSVGNVLGRYEAYCDANTAQPASEWRDLGSTKDPKTAAPASATALSGTLRSGDSNEGTVVCFAKTESSRPTIREAAEAFGKSGNLGAFGSVRYVYAKQMPSMKTHVLTAWTDDTFLVNELVPVAGKDAKGEDFSDVPRMPGTTRLLAARIENTEFGVNAYDASIAPDKVVSWYDEEMKKRGWFALDPEFEKTPEYDPKRPTIGRLYEKDGLILTLASRAKEDDVSKTTIGLGLAGSGPIDTKDASRMKR